MRARRDTLRLPPFVAKRGGRVVHSAERLLAAGGQIDVVPVCVGGMTAPALTEMHSHGPALLVDAFADAYER